MKRRCVFLDRDGVINVKAAPHEYIVQWDDFQLLPNVTDWIRLFNVLGFLVIVVTNQRCIARGMATLEQLDTLHRRMVEHLSNLGARIDDIFLCPHEEGTCACRKPQPGLVLQAVAKWNIDLPSSLLIGDSPSDAELAMRCGLPYASAANGKIVGVRYLPPERTA